MTPLMTNPGNVKLLVEAGADVNLCCKQGFSALYYALYSGKLKSAKFLLENGASTTLKTGRSVMSLLIERRHSVIESYELLVQYGANVNQMDSTGKTPLHVLLIHRFFDFEAEKLFEFFLDNKADVKVQADGQTSLSLCIAGVEKFATRTAKFLVRKYFALNEVIDKDGNNPVLLMIKLQRWQLLEWVTRKLHFNGIIILTYFLFSIIAY